MYQFLCEKCNGHVCPEKDGQLLICGNCGEKYSSLTTLIKKEYDTSTICPVCGADLKTHSSQDMLICPYCDSIFLLDDQRGSQYSFILPFSDTSKEQIEKRFFTACTTEFAPSDFREKVKIKNINNVFLPLYDFSVSFDVQYTLEVGHYEQRRVWSDTNKRYESKTITVWETQKGHLANDVVVSARGFDKDQVIRNKEYALDDEKNYKQFLLFNSILTSSASEPATKDYHPFYLGEHEVLPSVSADSAWADEGEKNLSTYITNAIGSLYAGQTRNIRFNGNSTTNQTYLRLFPISLVTYDYKNSRDQMIVLDGVDGKIYRGVLPLSAKKAAKNIARWLCLFGIPIAALILVLSGNLSESGTKLLSGMGLLVAGVLLAIRAFIYLGRIRGTGGDKNSDSAKYNKKNNTNFMVWGIILGLIIILCLCYYL